MEPDSMERRTPAAAGTQRNMRDRGTICLAFAAGLATADLIITALCLTPAWSLRGLLTPLAVVLVIAVMVAVVGAIMRTAGAADDD